MKTLKGLDWEIYHYSASLSFPLGTRVKIRQSIKSIEVPGKN